MKKNFTLLLFMSSFIWAQNVVVLSNASDSVSCDGRVYLENAVAFSSYDWLQGDSITVISSNVDTLNNLCIGNYYLRINDTSNTVISFTVSATTNLCVANPMSITLNVTPESGACDGGITSSVSGGNGGLTYSWSNSATTSNISNLCSGSYTLNVLDVEGCQASQTATVSLDTNTTGNGVCDTNPIVIVLSASCESAAGSCDGYASASVSGGNGNLTYAWSNGGNAVAITNLCEGNYTLTVSDDSLCTQSATTYVCTTAQDSSGVTALVATIDLEDVSAAGLCDGQATVSVTGGTAPYTYSYSNSATTASVNNLCAGVYSVTINDNGGQTLMLNFLIIDPQEIVVVDPVDNTVIVEDTLSSELISNCLIDYNNIASITLVDYQLISGGNEILVTWLIDYTSGTLTVTNVYAISNLSGIIAIDLSLYCGVTRANESLKARSFIDLTTISVKEFDGENKVAIFPNPAKGGLFKINSEKMMDQVKVFNVNGKIIESYSNIHSNQFRNEKNLEQGIYFIHVLGADKSVSVKKILVE